MGRRKQNKKLLFLAREVAGIKEVKKVKEVQCLTKEVNLSQEGYIFSPVLDLHIDKEIFKSSPLLDFYHSNIRAPRKHL